MRDDILYWIWLSLVFYPGSERGSKLLNYFGDPKEIYLADEKRLSGAPRKAVKGSERYLEDKDLTRPRRILEYCLENNVGIVTRADPLFPTGLESIASPPLLLYHYGSVANLSNIPRVAVVGSRNMSVYGAYCADKISFELAEKGACIVSGMARGIDSVAHKSALRAGGRTVAVLGCGVDVVYPSENRELYKEICAKGTLITEFAPGTPPSGKNFPIRNRVISGMSDAVVVAEAAVESGSLVTAARAASQRKIVFACPGRLTDENALGANSLLASGARVCLSASDVFESIATRYGIRTSERSAAEKKRTGFIIDEAGEREITERYNIKTRKDTLPKYKAKKADISDASSPDIPIADIDAAETPKAMETEKKREENALGKKKISTEEEASTEKLTAEDILSDDISSDKKSVRNAETMELEEDEMKLYRYLTGDPVFGEACYVDEISCGLDPTALLGAVMKLQIKGLCEDAGLGKIRAV